jgi:hypothetical protein
MAFMLRSGGIRNLANGRSNGNASHVTRGAGVITGAMAAGIAAGKLERKNIVTAGTAAAGAAGLFVLPGLVGESPVVRGVSEGLVGSAAAQLGAMVGAKMTK